MTSPPSRSTVIRTSSNRFAPNSPSGASENEKGLYVAPSEIDPCLWRGLEAADPEAICHNAQVRYSGELSAYRIPFLDTELLCFPHRQGIEIQKPDTVHKPGFELYLIVLHYLLEAQPMGLAGKWISEKDLPGGELFFRGPHRFPTDRILDLMGSDVELFTRACEALGGTHVAMGDCAFRLWPFPRVPLLLVLWKGDDEFKPSMQIRFDGSVNFHLRALDIIWAKVNVVCRSLYVMGKRLKEREAAMGNEEEAGPRA